MSKMTCSSQRGVALIIVLWITVLLTVMVSGFIAMVRTEARGVTNYKIRNEAYFLARSGINIAIAKLSEEQMRLNPQDEEAVDQWRWDGSAHLIPLWNGSVEVRIIDEGGKIDINLATRSHLNRALTAIGLEGSEKDEIVASILDWRDENNFHRLNGAEDDYYRSLPEPYESKDGPLDTTDELLWIKGVTPEIFFGKGTPEGSDSREFSEASITLQSGMKDLFTVYSRSVRVNLNTTSFAVLLSLPGMDEETAQAIIGAREVKPLQSVGDFTQAGGRLNPTMSQFIAFTSPSQTFTIESVGAIEKSSLKYAIKAVVGIDRDKQVRVIYWKDHDRIMGSAI